MGIKSNSSSEPYFNFFGQSSIDAVNPAPSPFAYYYPYGSPTAKTYLEAGDDFNTKVPGDYVFVMLATKSSVQTYGWGAGGQIGSDPTSFGGGAGAWDGTMTFTTGTTYRVIIGGSGTNPTFSSPTVNNYTASPFGGGGPGATSVPGGAGGGYSGIFETDTLSQANARLIAAGGGGANGTDAGTFASYGGYGGYPAGNRGSSPSTPAPAPAYGGSGNPTAGGAGGSTPGADGTAGSALQGGTAGLRTTNQGSGGGGGGGYYGGGGGGAGGYGGSSQSGTAGGGGSGYKHPTVTATMYTGSGSTGGNPSSPYKGSDVGDHQDPGRVVILFSA
jgi:hypothetical protein